MKLSIQFTGSPSATVLSIPDDEMRSVIRQALADPDFRKMLDDELAKVMKKAKQDTCYVVYDRGIQFLEPQNGPVVTFNREDAEKVLKFLNDYFEGESDKKGHNYKFEIIPIPDDKTIEDFVRELVDWAFEFDEWSEYGRDYWHIFDSGNPSPDKLNPDGSIRSLYHLVH